MPLPPLANKDNRTYAAAHFALELDNDFNNVGLFRSIEGGSVKADVMSYQTGGTHTQFRQLGKPKFDDLRLQVGMAMAQPFYTWVSRFFTGQQDTRSGAIVAADFYYNERARRKFSGAVIKEVGFPKLDATDKSAVYMSVGIAVEDMTFAVGTGQKLVQNSGMDQQRVWTACNFRVTLDGYDTSRVSKVDAFTCKQNIIENHVGGVRRPFKMMSWFERPTISFYLPEADAAPYYKRVSEGVISGKPAISHGGIEFLDPTGVRLASVAFMDADIVGVTLDKHDASTEEIRQVKVDLYCEQFGFSYGDAGALIDLQ
jgi:phage tail-like protein